MHFLRGLSKNELEKPLTLPLAHEHIKVLSEQIRTCSPERDEAGPGIVGQEQLVERLLIGLIVGDGHSLLEGNPGLAKTLSCRMAGEMAGLIYKRIQFMPDTMPSDLILKEFLYYDEDKAKIGTKLGPVFTNILLADEINRASPKTQAALLEACEEGHATPLNRARQVIRPVDPFDECELLKNHERLFRLEKLDPATRQGQLFIVLATQNPIEQEGVYPLSRAQEDRFLFKLIIDYPKGELFDKIARHAFDGRERPHFTPTEQDHVRTLYFFTALRRLLLGPEAEARWFSEQNRHLREKVEALINFSHVRPLGADREERSSMVWNGASNKQFELNRVLTRWNDDPHRRSRVTSFYEILEEAGPTFPEVLSGSSPRGLLKIIRAAHAMAFLHDHIDDDGHVHPTWDDFRDIAHDVLRHRIRLTAGSEAMGTQSDMVVNALLGWINQW